MFCYLVKSRFSLNMHRIITVKMFSIYHSKREWNTKTRMCTDVLGDSIQAGIGKTTVHLREAGGHKAAFRELLTYFSDRPLPLISQFEQTSPPTPRPGGQCGQDEMSTVQWSKASPGPTYI